MTRLVPLLALFLLAAAGGSARGAGILPSIYVEYSDDCVFSMHADGGIVLAATSAPGATIPPGSYQIVLRTPQDAPSCPMDFQLQGPGVQLHWDFGGEAIGAQVTEVLLPSSTYVATDLRNPARYRSVFSTAASGSSSSLVTQPVSTAKGTESSRDVVGSALLAYRGVLDLTVRPSGAPGVRARGKTVTRVKAGRYDLAVTDTSSRVGLSVLKPNRTVVALTAQSFVGTRTTRLALRPGTWRFTTARGTTELFVVA
jgi:hypothetical protein